MNLPLVGALALSVAGWTFAVVFFRMACKHTRMARKALAGWKMAEYRAMLAGGLLAQCHEANQALREKLLDSEDEGGARKRQ